MAYNVKCVNTYILEHWYVVYACSLIALSLHKKCGKTFELRITLNWANYNLYIPTNMRSSFETENLSSIKEPLDVNKVIILQELIISYYICKKKVCFIYIQIKGTSKEGLVKVDCNFCDFLIGCYWGAVSKRISPSSTGTKLTRFCKFICNSCKIYCLQQYDVVNYSYKTIKSMIVSGKKENVWM